MTKAHDSRTETYARNPKIPCPYIANRPRGARTTYPDDDFWDVFKLEDEPLEPEPEHGDFWEELDDD